MDERSSIDLDSDPREIVGIRVIDAPRDLVWQAWTDPKHLAQWWGPIGFTTTTHSFDMRPGGVWRFVMHGPDGRDYQNRITFVEVEEPNQIIYRHGGGEDVEPVQFETTVTFEDFGGKTKLIWRSRFPTTEQRAEIIKTYGADKGLVQTMLRLEEFVGEVLQEFKISRTFRVPRAVLWKAWSEAEHLAHWWGPKGFTWLAGKLDLRPGGVFQYGMRGPDGSEMWGKFVYREITAPKRLVFVNSFSDKDGNTVRAPFASDWPLEVLNIMTLEEHGGETVLTLRGLPINATEGERRRFSAMKPSMKQGFGGTFDQLADYLARMQ